MLMQLGWFVENFSVTHVFHVNGIRMPFFRKPIFLLA